MGTHSRVADNALDQARARAGITLLNLSNSTGIAYTTLRRKLEHPGDFTVVEWFKVCDAVGFDPARLASVVRGRTRKAA